MFKLLDCTLRDGGYYNNWDFSDQLVANYLSAIEKLPVDYVEVGYRNNAGRKQYEGKYFYCPAFVLEWVKKQAPSKELAVMFNEKEVRPADVKGLLSPCKGLAAIVRIATAPNRITQALALSEEIRACGFEVGLNIMYMNTLVDKAGEVLVAHTAQINKVVNYFSLVDSYGGVYPAEVSRLVKQCKETLTIPVGFHGHNNVELVFANSLAAIDAGCDIIDATITGMGRGAGNLKTELILTYLATRYKADVDFNALANVVAGFEELQKEYGWGTNLPYMVSGANSLPQKDVMDWVSKRAYSINSIIRGLDNQSKGQEDNLKLPKFNGSQYQFEHAVIIGGGPNAVEHAAAVKKFIEQQTNVCIIHASSKNSWAYAGIDVPQFFCLVGNEGHRLEKTFTDLENDNLICILPPFPRKMGTYIPEQVMDQAYELPVVDFTNRYPDSHTALALQAVLDMKIGYIYTAGYDGYSKGLNSNEQALFNENEYTFAKFFDKGKELHSLTPTLYTGLQPVSVYSLVEG